MSQTKKWTDVGRLLGYRGIPGLSTQLRNSYVRVIRPYEEFLAEVRKTSASTGLPEDASTFRDMKTPPPGENGAGPSGSASPLGSPLSNTSSPLSKPPDDGEVHVNGYHNAGSPNPRKHTSNGNGSVHNREWCIISRCPYSCFFASEPTDSNGRMANGADRGHALEMVNKEGRKGKQEVRNATAFSIL